MMKRVGLFSVVLLMTTLAVVVRGQTNANFSGTWTLSKIEPPIPLPVGGGSILLRVQVPEKLSFVWPLTTTARRVMRSTTENSPTRCIMVDSSVGVAVRHER